MKHTDGSGKMKRLWRTASALFVASVLFVSAYAYLTVSRDPAPAAASVSAPLPDAAPSPTTAPTATPVPTPTPEPLKISLNREPVTETVKLGKTTPLLGKIISNYPIVSVKITDTCAYNFSGKYPVTAERTYDAADAMRTLTLSEVFPTYAGELAAPEPDAAGLRADPFLLSDLTVGKHTIRVSALCDGQEKESVLYEGTFNVLSDDWEILTEKDFGMANYRAAYAFFGKDTGRFLYRYQRVDGRYIIADPSWERAHITELEGYGGRKWLVHVDAVPYYEKAFSYLERVRFRVHGTNGDTGVLPLKDCIVTYNGSYVSRFVSSMKTVSFHAFGTASDINADMAPNRNNKENKSVIRSAVKNDLVYNGILGAEDGEAWYDFTYSGSGALTEAGIPEAVINYLLYELAFYRAGFQWGYYYSGTSDGMHFTLAEKVSGSHNSKSSLRKVFTYIPSDDAPDSGPAETAG